jgi:hypothetical protein
LPTTNKLSVASREGPAPSLASLRRYVEKSTVVGLRLDSKIPIFPTLSLSPKFTQRGSGIVDYHSGDLDAVCSHDGIIGWVSKGATGRGGFNRGRSGCGRIDEHGSVEFGTRAGKVLAPVQALHVMDDSWPVGASADDNVVFLDDDAGRYCCCYRTAMVPPNRTNPPMNSFWAVPVFLPIKFLNLRCGTFDGLHFWSSQIVNLGHVLGESSHWSIVGVKRRNAEKKETLNTFLV